MSHYHDPDPKASAKMRRDMVENQLRARGIWDQRVLQAFDTVKRHEFVSEALYRRAYDDNPLPIGSSQTISQPYIVAYMTQALQLEGTERVLEIGTGSGYQTAILAELARYVVSVERIPDLFYQAQERLLDGLAYSNIHLLLNEQGDLAEAGEGFDRVLVTAAVPSPPDFLLAKLAPGGLMVAPIGDRGVQDLYRITREGGDYRPEGESWGHYPGFYFRRLLGVRFVPLIGRGGWND
jgi:protein-L-isoaspartate(D-aspartate) O-methyltransferase